MARVIIVKWVIVNKEPVCEQYMTVQVDELTQEMMHADPRHICVSVKRSDSSVWQHYFSGQLDDAYRYYEAIHDAARVFFKWFGKQPIIEDIERPGFYGELLGSLYEEGMENG